MPATQERKLYDLACDKWDQYQHQRKLDLIAQQLRPSARSNRRHSRLLSEAAATVKHLPTIPDTITMRNGSTRPAMDFEEAIPGVQGYLARSNSQKGGHFGTSRTGRRTISRSRSHISLVKDSDLPDDLGDDIAHPSHLLCRSMRVFVAWKA